MNSTELKELLDYIQEHHSWEHMIDNMTKEYKDFKPIFKYVDICYDTREIDTVTPFHVWSITLRSSSKEYLTFTEQACNINFIKQVLSLPYYEVSAYIQQCKEFTSCKI